MAPADHMRERALSRLRAATSYWLATTRPDGRPHSMPVWGVLVGDEFWFGTAGQKVRNLRHQPYAIVHHESADDVAIIEGVVERRPFEDAPDAVVAAFRDKYVNPADRITTPVTEIAARASRACSRGRMTAGRAA